MSNQDRIKELIRKNKIINLCKRWGENNIDINDKSFLSVEETVLLQENVLKKFDKMDENESSIICYNEKEIVNTYSSYMKKNIEIDKEYVFFVAECTELGGVKLTGKQIIDKNEFIVNESEYGKGSCSIIISTVDASSGICMWRGEYDCRVYIW